MDLLDLAEAVERIELLAKYVCVDESSTRERQVALIWISEIAEDVGRAQRAGLAVKTPAAGGYQADFCSRSSSI